MRSTGILAAMDNQEMAKELAYRILQLSLGNASTRKALKALEPFPAFSPEATFLRDALDSIDAEIALQWPSLKSLIVEAKTDGERLRVLWEHFAEHQGQRKTEA
jgi:hypothetical protein